MGEDAGNASCRSTRLVMNSFRFSVLFVVVFICILVSLIVFIMFNQLFLLFLFQAIVHLTFTQT